MRSRRSNVERLVAASLIDQVQRDHAQSDEQFTRRRVVVAATLVMGAILLGISLSVRPGDPAFYVYAVAVAAMWTVGGLLSGPLHLGRMSMPGKTSAPGETSMPDQLRRPVVAPVVTGIAAGALFLAGALVVREIPTLRDHVDNVLAHARGGAIVPVLAVAMMNGIAEEIFFRGALYAAIGRRYPVSISTGVYAVTTVVTGNPMLVFAAATLGFVLALQRRASGGVLAPILTHVTWSTVMLLALPPLFAS